MNLVADDATHLVRARVRSELARVPGWCLALDDVQDITVLADLIPQNEEAGGHVIVSCRLKPEEFDISMRGQELESTSIKVGALEPAETVELLMKGAGETDEAAAAKLGEILDHHAMAVADAASYVGQDPDLTLADYSLIVQSEIDAVARFEGDSDCEAHDAAGGAAAGGSVPFV